VPSSPKNQLLVRAVLARLGVNMERRSVDIGGAALDAVVAGDGPVTVVLENGLATPLEEWAAIAPRIAERTRVLRYDRRRASAAGRLSARTAVDMASDLERLLAALALKPPYVLVGHSWGGIVGRMFAHAHPTAVVGTVFVDATHEVIDSAALTLLPVMYSVMGLASRTRTGHRWLFRLLCPTNTPSEYRLRLEQRLNDPRQWRIGLRTARAEGAGIRVSLAWTRRHCPELPPIPVHVLTAGGFTGANVKSVRRVHEAWRATVARRESARYTNAPTSGHQLPMEAPVVVIDAIVGVLDAVETTLRFREPSP
jgi:pimeloyl-ACP methyl ester carboxylesterase